MGSFPLMFEILVQPTVEQYRVACATIGDSSTRREWYKYVCTRMCVCVSALLYVCIDPRRCAVYSDAATKASEDRKAMFAGRRGEKEEEEEVEAAVEEVVPEVDEPAIDVAAPESLELEEGTPKTLAVTLGKVAVVSARLGGGGTAYSMRFSALT